MKTKLTVTIDEEIVPRAKEFARRRGVSLSSLIERALRDLSSRKQPYFEDRWRGAFQPSQQRDERYRRLAKKYL